MSWLTISIKRGKHLKTLCEGIVMLLPIGSNMHCGKKARKKFKELEVFLSVLLTWTIEILHCG